MTNNEPQNYDDGIYIIDTINKEINFDCAKMTLNGEGSSTGRIKTSLTDCKPKTMSEHTEKASKYFHTDT